MIIYFTLKIDVKRKEKDDDNKKLRLDIHFLRTKTLRGYEPILLISTWVYILE